MKRKPSKFKPKDAEGKSWTKQDSTTNQDWNQAKRAVPPKFQRDIKTQTRRKG
jgi:hypothetical protein